jgi:predicted permease
MKHLRQMAAKLLGMFRKNRTEADLAREIASHLGMLEDEFLRRGMTPAEARRAARRAYGGVEQAKQSHRDERSILWVEQTLQDIRHAIRALARNPGFTLVAVITLALGIGLNTTIFSAYNAVALKPLPVADAKTVVRLERWFKDRALGDIQYAFSYPEYVYCREHQDVFTSVIAASWPLRVLAVIGDAHDESGNQIKTLFGQAVSGNYFTGLGINAANGRTFGPLEDETPGANPVMVLSYAFWQREFNGDPGAVGKILKINGTAFTIIGVTRREFTGTSVTPQIPDFWAPIGMQPQLVPGRNWLTHPEDYRLQVLARLKPTTGWNRAQAEITGLVQQFFPTYVPQNPTIKVTLQPTAFFGNTEDVRFQAGVAMLMVIVGMVLLVACANIANMLLARGAARQREISVRMALGASRGRVIRHLLTESVLVALAGGLAGLVLATFASKLLWVEIQQMLTRLLGSEFVFGLNLNPDARVLGYALGLSVVTGIVFGLSPALQFTRKDLSAALKDETSILGQRVSRSLMRKVLVGGQVAVSMVLLTSAGLLVRGLLRAQSADPGFDTQHVFLVLADFGDDRVKAAARSRRLGESLSTLPGIEGVTTGTPPMFGSWTPPIVVKTSSAMQGEVHDRTMASYASDTYFDTLGIPLLRGRCFSRQEASAGSQVSIISESTARRFWPGEDALGKHFQLDEEFDGKLTDFEVIGIAKDIRFANMTRVDPAHVYLPTNAAKINTTLIRIKGDPRLALAAVHHAVQHTDANLLPGLTLWNADSTLVAPRRSMAQALAAFASILALLALTLAGVGIYGVMAYIVSQRTQEIGVRMALGATAGRVLRSVALPGLRPVVAGMMIGIASGAGLSWFLHSTLVSPETNDFLYGVSYYDPCTFAALACFLALVALLASLAPAMRVLTVDPAVALRYE